MGTVRRNSSFLISIALILATGTLLFGGVVVVRVVAAESTTAAAPPPSATDSNNAVSSYGLENLSASDSSLTATGAGGGYEPLTITPTDETPDFIAESLAEQQGIVLLVYVQGASDDMEMLSYFNTVKAQYAADSSFFSFEAIKTTELGDTLGQLRASNPPVLAIIDGNGEVSELYTGWIGLKVMEQRVADAVRGL